MSIMEIIELVALGLTALGLISSIVVAIGKGKVKDFVIEKMEEAEETGLSGAEKLAFVVQAVKAKYKLAALVLNIEAFVEKVIAVTKKIN